jgi:hypothetical protein
MRVALLAGSSPAHRDEGGRDPRSDDPCTWEVEEFLARESGTFQLDEAVLH